MKYLHVTYFDFFICSFCTFLHFFEYVVTFRITTFCTAAGVARSARFGHSALIMPALKSVVSGVLSSIDNIFAPRRTAFKRKTRARKADARMAGSQQHLDRVSQTEASTCLITNHQMHLLNVERELMPRRDYIRSMQTHRHAEDSITEQNRSDIIHYQIQCAYELEMSSGAMFMSIAYFDRFLSVCRLRKRYLSILSAVCLFVASKYEDTVSNHFNISVLMDTCEIKTNEKRELLLLERKLLETLDHRLCQPTCYTFIISFLKEAGIRDKRTFYFATLLAQIFQTDCVCLKYMYSIVGKISALISIKTINNGNNGPQSDYLLSELQALKASNEAEICLKDMQSVIEREYDATNSEIIRRFGSDEYFNVAHITPCFVDILLIRA